MKHWIFFITLVTSTFAWNQKVHVEGSCVGKKNKALENVQIKVKQYPALSLLTDKNGKYAFDAALGDTLLIQFSFEDLKDQQTVIIKKQKSKSFQKSYFPFPKTSKSLFNTD